jgi:hypothetical protein
MHDLDLEREELTGENIDDPNRRRNCIIIGIVAVGLLALTLIMGFGHSMV